MNVNKKQSVIAGLIYCTFAVIISRIPLFNYLGYEFSTAIAFLVPVIGGIITFSRLKREPPLNQKDFFIRMFDLIRSNIVLLAGPFAVITINAIFVKNCSYVEGFAFFLLIPVVTAFFIVALAGFCWTLFHRYRLAYTTALFIILFYPLYIGFSTPQIYSYNFIYGYFPGFSYDEVLTLSPQLILFRLITAIAGLVLMFTADTIITYTQRGDSFWKKIISLRKILRPELNNVSIIFLLLLLSLLWMNRNSLGLESSTGDIRSSLGSTISTEHFRIFYSKHSFSEDEIHWVATEHEFRFHQVEAALQLDFSETIDSYIYPDADTKRKFIGTGTTNIAKPWRKEIHLNYDSWQGTLKHELVHVLAGEFGIPIIHAHYHIGLVEGLATAIDGEWGNRTLHEYAAAMTRFELVKNPAQLIKPLGFALNSSSLSYVMMGSFCKFLIDRYGMVHFKELYGGKTTERVYGKSYEQLVEAWQQFLERIPVPDEWRGHVEFYFKRPSIFAKECARAVAKMNDDAWRQLAVNNSIMAMQEFSRSMKKSWNTEAYNGFIRSAYQSAQYDTVIQSVGKQLQDTLQRTGILNLMLIYGDALWYKNDPTAARGAYEKIILLDLSPRFNEAAALRLTAIDDRELCTVLPDFFMGSFSDSSAILLLENLEKHNANPLLPYLKAKVYFRMKRFDDARRECENISSAFGIPILNEMKEELLGEVFFKVRKFQPARLHFWQSLNYASNETSPQRVNDWLERCAWFEKSELLQK